MQKHYLVISWSFALLICWSLFWSFFCLRPFVFLILWFLFAVFCVSHINKCGTIYVYIYISITESNYIFWGICCHIGSRAARRLVVLRVSVSNSHCNCASSSAGHFLPFPKTVSIHGTVLLIAANFSEMSKCKWTSTSHPNPPLYIVNVTSSTQHVHEHWHPTLSPPNIINEICTSTQQQKGNKMPGCPAATLAKKMC